MEIKEDISVEELKKQIEMVKQKRKIFKGFIVIFAIMIVGIFVLINNYFEIIGIKCNKESCTKESKISFTDSQKQMFNSIFISYEGNQKGILVKSMISSVITSNSDDNAVVQVSVNGEIDVDKLAELRASIASSKTYTVKFTYTEGVITAIYYEEKSVDSSNEIANKIN